MANVNLTRDKLRADIARLLHEDPEEIGGDDDLADLGLDSMRAMALLLQWNEAGLDLDFSAFAEKLTLDAWWDIIQKQMMRRG